MDDPREEALETYRNLCSELKQQVKTYKRDLRDEKERRRIEEYDRRQSKIDVDYKMRVKPKSYDGSRDWITYYNQFEMISRLYNWDLDTKEFMLYSCLEGDALEVMSIYQHPTYDDMCQALAKSFGPGEEETAYAKLQTRKRKKDEPLDQLGRDIMRLVRCAKPEDTERSQSATAAEYFIKALPDPEIRLQLKDARLRTIEDVVSRAEILIANRETEKDITRGKDKQIQEEDTSKSKLDSFEEKIAQLTEKIERIGESQKTCQTIPREEDYAENDQTTSSFRGRGRGRSFFRGRGRGRSYGRGPGRGRGYGRGFQRGNGRRYGYFQPDYQMVCYKCGMPGHFQMYCPMNQVNPQTHWQPLPGSQTVPNFQAQAQTTPNSCPPPAPLCSTPEQSYQTPFYTSKQNSLN